jgi:hypothetical protein
VSTAHLFSTVATSNPGAFSGISNKWVAWTVVIRPA